MVDSAAMPEDAAMTVEHNRRIAREWIETFNARNHAAEDELLRSDYLAHAPASLMAEPLDRKGWGEFLAMFVKGFPDLHLAIEDAVADEHMVAQRILFTGTHTGDFNGLPPTRRKVNFTGLELNLVVDGQVAEHWFELDQVALLRQLGLIVVPGPRLVPPLLTAAWRRLARRWGRASDSPV
jgi:predicted ester cyclase